MLSEAMHLAETPGPPVAATIVFAPPPFAYNRKEALAYTRLSPKRFKQLEDAGEIVGRPDGRNGETLYLRPHLETVMLALFGAGGPGSGKKLDELL
jgi:hypothetical protein